jgi:hypothetical protein
MGFGGNGWRALLAEAHGFVGAYSGQYPNFVFGGDVAGAAPVFVYHRLEALRFARHLEHLQRNQYRTLTADELYDDMARASSTDRRVALTFDDGLDHLYTVVFPLLREFRCKAIAYIVPTAIGTTGFVTWEQIREMHDSGCLDFQSHSMTHRAIFTSPRIVDFLHPGYARQGPWDVPETGPGDTSGSAAAFGAPLFTSNARLSDARRYLPDAYLREVCVSHVAGNGGDRFFSRRRWRQELRKVARSFTTQHAAAGSYEDDEARERCVREELESSRREIEKRLPGKTVRHFAFPWHQSGEFAREASLRAGYVTLAGGLAGNSKPARLGHDAFAVPRVNGDFVPTLPGAGRQHFWRVMLGKAARRTSGRPY